MQLRRRVRHLLAKLRHPRRRVWSSARRTHLETVEVPAATGDELLDEMCRRLERHPGVDWARANRHLGGLVVSHRLPEELASEILAHELEHIEAQLGLDDRPFVVGGPEHPGDEEPLRRTLVEMGADVAGLVTGFGMKMAGIPKFPVEVDFAALLSLFEGVPTLRKAIERRLGFPAADLVFGLANSVSSALLQGTMGPATDLVLRWLRVREIVARREAWREREQQLCEDPSAHEGFWAEVEPRPGELPGGPIEQYTEKAVAASLVAFGLVLLSTRRLDRAAAGLFGGLPKPARLGREAFAAHLGRRLAHRGVVVMRSKSLRQLDRIRCIVVHRRLLASHSGSSHPRHDPLAEAVLAAARRAELRLVVTVESDEDELMIEPDELVAGGPPLSEEIRRLQASGLGVAYVGSGRSIGFASADVSLGVAGADGSPPWGADLLGKNGLDDVLTLIESVAAARVASQHGVYMSMIEAASGVLLALGGLKSRTVRRIMAAANAASLVAMANGVRLAHGVTHGRPNPVTPDDTPWHTLDPDEVLSRLETAREGLSTAQAEQRRLPPPKAPSAASRFGAMFVDELATPLAPILGAGAGLSAMMGAVVDAAMIGGVVAINTVFGAAQRLRTEKLLSAMDDEEQPPIRVRRDGKLNRIDPALLVHGDIVELDAGDVVPADCRIVEAAGLEVDESSLTGESLPVCKGPDASSADAIAQRSSMLYEATTVAAGRATAVVTATGLETEAGRAAIRLESGRGRTGVEARLESLTSLTAPVAALSGLAVIAAGMLRGRRPQEVLSAGVSLSVAAVPEGLPLLATVAQLSAAGRLSKHGALVRNPRAVEALARIDMLCADKTGTLTEGRIRLRAVSDGRTVWNVDQLDDTAKDVLAVGRRACPHHGGKALPHLTDMALIEGAAEAGVESPHGRAGWTRIGELPFEPGRGFHATVGRTADEAWISVKGAPEVIIPRCESWRRGETSEPLDEAGRKALFDRADEIAENGLRVLAVAERTASMKGDIGDERVTRLEFCGFVALADAVRATAKAAIADLRKAGVDVIMITGDHPSTARAIAVELDLPDGSAVITGPELEAMSDADLEARIASISVFARVTPAQKVRIVRALKHVGRTVAMTGDGANDAPAIRLADVGIALGEGATPAARRAADVVVTDGRIETIVRSVLEGRALWASLRDAVSLLVGGNLGEIGFTLIAGLVSGRSPLNARQLMLVNLLTDALPALSVAVRPPIRKSPEDLLSEGPDASLGSALQRDIIWRGVITSGTTAGAWLAARMMGGKARADTVALLSLVGTQLGQTLIAGGRSPLVIATSLGSFAVLLATVETPGLSHFFGCRPLGPLGLAQAGMATLAGMAASTAVPIARHYFTRRRRDEQTTPGSQQPVAFALPWDETHDRA